jgi:UDP-N-acetylmuramoyl-tripeptide--D-alanyl-D-alanine ligase
LNANNQKAYEQKEKTRAKVISYSVLNTADISAGSMQENFTEKPYSELNAKTPSGEITLKFRGVGMAHASAVLCATAVGEVLKVEKDLIIKGVEQYKPQGGRMNLILGLKHALVLDDSYNASPEAVNEALKVLARMPQAKKIAVLGDMKELGDISQSKHEEVGKLAASLNLSHLFTVGFLAKAMGETAIVNGLENEKWQHFNSSEEAKKAVSEILDEQTAVLIKGSQSMRMEKITKEIMAEPARAEELLCRQYGHWLKE